MNIYKDQISNRLPWFQLPFLSDWEGVARPTCRRFGLYPIRQQLLEVILVFHGFRIDRQDAISRFQSRRQSPFSI